MSRVAVAVAYSYPLLEQAAKPMKPRHKALAIALVLALVAVISANVRKRVLNRQLSDAVYASDLQKAESLLREGASPNSGKGLLGFAIAQHQREIAKRLIEAGAEPTGRALAGAVKGNETEIALTLLAKGADVGFGTRYFGMGEPLLYSAVENQNERLVAALIQRHAPLDKTHENSGMTPLHLAVLQNDATFVATLLAAGANPNLPDIYLNSPLASAIKNENEEIIRLLLQNHADIDQKACQGYSPLMIACAQGNEAIVAHLLERKPNLNVRTEAGWTVMRLARPFPKIVALLKKAGANEGAE